MRYRHFSPLGRYLSVLVLGTTVYRNGPEDVSTELLDAWAELGGNVVDCGREYGESERVLGRWLRGRARPDEIAVLTKGAHQDETRRRVTPADITADLLESLDVLGLETIDLYLLHRDDPSQPVGPIVETLNEHLGAGRIRAFGASNWTTARLDEANAFARTEGLHGFSCSSPGLSLARQNEPPWADSVAADDDASRAWYARTGLPMFPWSSQASGFFGGVSDAHVLRVYGSEENVERYRRAARLGARIGHSANEVALAWVLAQPFPTHAIIGPRSVEELHRSVSALRIELSPDEWRWLALDGELEGASSLGEASSAVTAR